MAEADSSKRVRGRALGIVVAGIALGPSILLTGGNVAAGQTGAQQPPDPGPVNQQMLGASGILPRDERLADPVGVTDPLAIPPLTRDAYQRAASILQLRVEGCQLDWSLLAGLGKVVSDHGGGLRPVLGPPLDGSPGRARIVDTDNGSLDGDRDWDRAAGLMQIMPAVWSHVGADSDGDGTASPHNIYDAALGAGRYLCADNARLGDQAGQAQAVFRYQRSRPFVASVLGWAHAYGHSTPLPQAPGAAVPLPVLPPPASLPPFPAAPPPGPMPPGPVMPPAGPPQPPPGTPPPSSLALPRVPWDGGPASYARFPSTAAAGWTDPKFFPIGVWFESVLQQRDVDLDKAAGLNTYVVLTDNTDMALVRSNGMSAILGKPLPGYGSETAAWLIADEADMVYGPGSDPWAGQGGWNTCIPTQEQRGRCGYTVMQTLADRLPTDGRPRYANFGKGVLEWETDAEAERFVNPYTDFTSADLYYYTDPHKSPQDRRAANYGALIDRMHKLDVTDGKRQPIWAFIEVGHPFSESDAPTITADQIAGAVWNSLIHESRGIIYFNHNFGGPCISQHVLRDACGAAVRPTVTHINRQITELAPILNTQSYQWTFNPALDTMLKEHNGSFYIFAMPGPGNRTGQHTLTLPPGIQATHAEVLYENRQVPIGPAGLTDTFNAEHQYHIYRITP